VTGTLSGCSVWLTRPSGQSGPWQAALEQQGARVTLQPLLEIGPPPQPHHALRALATAESADFIMATSANAVASAWQLRPEFAPVGQLLAVGQATADALSRATGRGVQTPATASDSEGLLALPALADMVGRRVALLGGAGGRALLAQALADQGAQVDKVVLYQRVVVRIAPDVLAKLLAHNQVIVVTSGEALAHLLDLAAHQQPALARCGLVVPSARVVQQASHALDWTTAPVAIERMGTAQLVEAVARVCQRRRQ